MVGGTRVYPQRQTKAYTYIHHAHRRMDGRDPTAGTRGTDETGRGLPNATQAATWWRVFTGPESTCRVTPGSRPSEPGDDVLVGVPYGQAGAGWSGPDVELDGLIRPPDIDRRRGRVAAHRHDPDTAVGLEPRVDARHGGRTHPGDRDVAEMQAHAVLGREAVDLHPDGLPVKGAPEKQHVFRMKAGQWPEGRRSADLNSIRRASPATRFRVRRAMDENEGGVQPRRLANQRWASAAFFLVPLTAWESGTFIAMPRSCIPSKKWTV